MIPIGIRLPIDVSHPEEPIALLPNGPTDKPEMTLDGMDKDGIVHIKRIILTRPAEVELLRAESPSRIWVRLKNHITNETLTFREPFQLTQKREFRVKDYALAPIEERVYRRCRILNLSEDLVQVFFIDDGSESWVKRDCLAELNEYYMYFPWQAIQISLFSLLPALVDFGPIVTWSPETCQELEKILAEFPLLRVEPVLSSVVFNDYARPTPVKIFGIDRPEEQTEQSEKEQMHKIFSILDVLTDRCPDSCYAFNMFDAAYQEFFEVRRSPEEVQIPEEIEDYQSSFPVDWKQKSVAEELEEEEKRKELFSKDSMTPAIEENEWNPRLNRINMLSVEQLAEKFIFPDDRGEQRIMLAVEGKCTKSPYEWYARPIVKIGKNANDEMVEWDSENGLREVDKVDWMIYGNDQLLSFAEQLDTYYSNVKNRKPLKGDEIQKMRKEGREVFAVCAVNEDKAMYTGEWQRVLIVNCDTFAEVQFLDSGGHDMVLTSSLYRIHEQHCRFPPMCLRLSMHGIATRINAMRADKKWDRKETSRFRLCLREDVPIFINLRDMAELVPESPDDPRSFIAKHVLMVRDVHYIDEARSVLDRFIRDEIGFAARSPNDPAPWP